jgi:hypothetical protein
MQLLFKLARFSNNFLQGAQNRTIRKPTFLNVALYNKTKKNTFERSVEHLKPQPYIRI